MNAKDRFAEMMTGPTEVGKSETWRALAMRMAKEADCLEAANGLLVRALEDIAIKAENFRENDPRTRRFTDFGQIAQIARAALPATRDMEASNG